MSFYSAFAEHYEAIFPFSVDVYEFLRKHLPEPPVRVLDVGCGTGHYTGALARDGYEAVGIDLDPAMIAYAQSHYPEAPFHVLNMTDVSQLEGPFDAGFCIGNTAAHLDRAAFEAFVAAMAETVTPGGAWILQVMNWDYVLTQETVTFPVIEGADGSVFRRWYREISETTVTFVTRLEVDGEVVFEEAVPLTPVRSEAIVAIHAAQGFDIVTHTGSYSGAPFDPETFSANVFVFRKGAT
jgi:2-polyprenyl-3-methyl-5-hydroxy-6-metoxy-1,4-benzoquinol methylase